MAEKTKSLHETPSRRSNLPTGTHKMVPLTMARTLALAIVAACWSILSSQIAVGQSSPDPAISTEGLVNSLSRGPKLKLRTVPRKTGPTKQPKIIQLEQLLKLRGLDRLTPKDRREIVTVVSELDLPAVDLEVPFDYNSDEISAKALPVLAKLGIALADVRLKDAKFIVAGHTDAKGGADYNLALSRRRAEAVTRLLIESFNIDASRLIAVGFGEEALKSPDAPNGAQNRRVQLVNVSHNP